MSLNRERVVTGELVADVLIMRGNVIPAKLAGSSAQQYPLGSSMYVGDREYVYVQATEDIALSAACLIEVGYTVSELDATNAAQGTGGSRPVGVAMAALVALTTKFGWVAVKGQGIPVKTAIAAVGTRMVATSTAGQLDDAATGASTVAVLGIALEVAQASTAGIKPATLTYPFVATEPVA